MAENGACPAFFTARSFGAASIRMSMRTMSVLLSSGCSFGRVSSFNHWSP
jgi:hypothetical protein